MEDLLSPAEWEKLGFCEPQVTAKDAKESFMGQIKNMNFSKRPDNWEHALTELEILYAPAQWKFRPITLQRVWEAVRAIRAHGKGSKSPGLPFLDRKSVV